MDIINSNVDEEADVIFGTTTDENLDKDKVRITIIATGFEREANNSEPNSQQDPASDSTLKLVNPKDMSQKINRQETLAAARKKVSGDEFTSDEVLDIPAFLRRQMD